MAEQRYRWSGDCLGIMAVALKGGGGGGGGVQGGERQWRSGEMEVRKKDDKLDE